MFDDREFLTCIGNALFIHERTPAVVVPSSAALNPFFVEQRVERWQQAVTSHEDQEWQSFLTSQGWQQSDMVRLCGQVQLIQLPAGDSTWIGVIWHAWEHILAPEHWQRVRAWYTTESASDDDIAVILPFLDWVEQQCYPRGTKATTVFPDDPHILVRWVGQQLLVRLRGHARTWASANESRQYEWRRTPTPSFIMHADGWHDFAQAHPWLMRCLATMTQDLVEQLIDAGIHLVADWMMLRQYGNLPRGTPQVTEVSNAPTAYRMVGGFQFTIAHQHVLIYVPHQVPNTHVLNPILDWLQRRGAPEIVVTPRQIVGHRHQWVIMPELRMASKAEIHDYAQHIGALAALCDMVGITQLTPHDVLGSGAIPCLIDATSIGTEMANQPKIAHQLFWSPQHPHPEYAPVYATSMANFMGVSDSAVIFDEWRDDIIAGYQRYYEFIAQRRESLYRFITQQESFQQRMWPHTYHEYAACLRLLDSWDAVRDGFDASLLFESHMQRRHLAHEPWYRIIEVTLCRGQIPALFQTHDHQGICANLSRMGALHRLTHAAHLHYALTPCDRTTDSGRPSWNPSQAPLLASDTLAQEALRIGIQIAENRIGMPAGDTWLIMGHSERDGLLRLADSNLVDGNSGIAMSLAALSILPGGEVLAAHAQRAFDYALEQNHRQPEYLGGVCFAVAQSVARLPNAQRTIEHCLQLIRQHASAPANATWVDGQASLIIGLTALQRVLADTTIFGVALSAGERLLQARQRNAAGERTWYGTVLPNGGFGSSGVLLALVRLYEMSQDYRFLRAAIELSQHEDASYDDSRCGWADTRFTTPSYPITWCYGSVGVAMGRLALIPHQPTNHDHQRLQELLDGIDSIGLHEDDGLCCGSAGAIDTMLSVARFTHNTHYIRRSTYWITQMIQRAHDRGGYVCHGATPGIYEHPGLWQGTAGIAYQIARCAYPRLFPSLLANEFRRIPNQSGLDADVTSGVK